ncbi:MAG: hypothetical protein KJ952_07010 [Candidatus Omnitrophica bacterium]|nr:hypothetical protein [Candidatus Omnitrophota bacterium]
MIKEKIVFWSLLAVFISIVIFGFVSQGKKKEAKDALLQDIEIATKKSRAQKKMIKDSMDFDGIKAVDTIDGYRHLLKRSPFFRPRSETEVKKVEVVPLKVEPKKPLFKYKGRVMMGSKVMVIIEDQGTGKSLFLQEGEAIGDFVVSRIGEKDVSLKKKNGEEIVLRAVKKEVKEEEKKKTELNKTLK